MAIGAWSPRIVLAAVLVVAACWTTSSWLGAREDVRTAVQPWEHQQVLVLGPPNPADEEFAAKIEALGRAGWELVDVESIPGVGVSTTITTAYFFKRPLPLTVQRR